MLPFPDLRVRVLMSQKTFAEKARMQDYPCANICILTDSKCNIHPDADWGDTSRGIGSQGKARWTLVVKKD